MNQELKDKWVAALRSGEYKQGRGVLKTQNSEYCCLGVLCNLVDDTKWTLEKGDDVCIPVPRYKDDARSSCLCMPPISILGQLPSNFDPWTLVKMNDTQELSFLEIADYIEANLIAEDAPQEVKAVCQ